MYATIRHFRTRGLSIEEIGTNLHRELLPMLAKLPGFVDYHLVDAGDDALISIGVYASKDVEEESNRIAIAWISEKYGDRAERVATYEGPIVAFQRGSEIVV